MIPAQRVTIVRNDGGRVEAHVARARTSGIDVVDRWDDGTWSCTCYASMVLQKVCDHIVRTRELVAPECAS